MDEMRPIGDVMREVADELEAQPQGRRERCPTHGEFVSRAYTLYDGGRVHWSRCQPCEADRKAAQEAAEVSRKASEEARLHAERLDRAGIPRRFRTRTLESFEAKTDAQRKALGIASEFAAEFPARYTDGANLIFAGLPGTGKSHLALGIAQAIMPRWNSVYVTARELVTRLRATWRHDSAVSEVDLQQTFCRTHLLIIDEVGVQFGTEAERTQLFGIIDDRYREQRPTILLTNLDANGFREFIGARAFDRLKECGEWIAFDWESYRGAKRA